MSTTILICAAAAFVWRIWTCAQALRNLWLVALVVIVSASFYFAPWAITGLSISAMLGHVSAISPRIVSAALAAVLFGLGYGVSLFMDRARHASRLLAMTALFAGISTGMLVAEVRLSADVIGLWHRFLQPDLWFAAGVAAYIVLRSSVYDRSPDVTTDYPLGVDHNFRRRRAP